MDSTHAFILGVIEGLTEFLPISSTGHLILTAKVLGLEQSEFLKTFEIVIQLGAIMAVVVLYGRFLWNDIPLLKKVLLAFLPTAVVGLLLYKTIKQVFLGSHHIVLYSLFLGGLFLIFFEKWHRKKKDAIDELDRISYGKAFLVGVFQSLSVIPGVSRAAATIIGGLISGLNRRTIVEFSFLLAVPTMLAAAGWDLIKSSAHFDGDQLVFLSIGFLTSFVVAVLSIKFFLRYIKDHDFMAFGFYRIAVALFFWALFR